MRRDAVATPCTAAMNRTTGTIATWSPSGLTISASADIVAAVKDLLLLYRSLADETRLRILALLLGAGELCVSGTVAVAATSR
ncbi:hypothetical protein GMPD_37800 [Geomonas paludis]|uniref:HTH arsR-type domain-containing protein n=1 Tax=Geomonas paludis TaxID=2740185 RepID=A0A6V8N0D7_9BACT|nr:hypothetical protein GMPD_37800 [Geomonas paludis]